MIEILNRWTNAVIYRSKAASSITDAVIEAARKGADLNGADLSGADLCCANLTDALLNGADLNGADLNGADLSGANLRSANLRSADLSGAVLSGAVLRGVNFNGADLSGADLSGANLRSADLSGANLRGANLSAIRDDIWAILSSAPSEVVALRVALVEGRVDGSSYRGECACLVGTLARARHCEYDQIPGLVPDSTRPAERFFACISKGDTPENSQAASLALMWIDQWLANMREAFRGGKGLV